MTSPSKLGGTNHKRNGNETAAYTEVVAQEFKHKLDALLEGKASISKEKMNQIVDEAIKSVKNYKHVVYYVESFIKKVRFHF